MKGLLLIFVLPWAVPALPTFISIHWMLNGEWGLLNNLLWDLFHIDGPSWLNLALAGPRLGDRLLHLEMDAVLDRDPAGRADGDPAGDLRGGRGRRRDGVRRFVHVTFPLLANLYLICTLLSTIWTLGDFNTVYFVTGGGPALSTHVLATLGIRDAFEMAQPRSRHGGGDVGAAAADPAGDHPDAQARERREVQL